MVPDQNECLDGSMRCDQSCTNQLASYTCSCDDGYILQTDALSCKGTSMTHPRKHLTHICKGIFSVWENMIIVRVICFVPRKIH